MMAEKFGQDLNAKLDELARENRDLRTRLMIMEMFVGKPDAVIQEVIKYADESGIVQQMPGAITMDELPLKEKLVQLHRIVQSNTQRLNALDGAPEKFGQEL